MLSPGQGCRSLPALHERQLLLDIVEDLMWPQSALSLPCMGLARSDDVQCLNDADMRQLCHAGAAAMCCSWQVVTASLYGLRRGQHVFQMQSQWH